MQAIYKEGVLSQTDKLIKSAKQFIPSAKVLMLTNKSIAEKNKFLNLYNINELEWQKKKSIEKYIESLHIIYKPKSVNHKKLLHM